MNSCDKQVFKIGTILEKQEHKVMITRVYTFECILLAQPEYLCQPNTTSFLMGKGMATHSSSFVLRITMDKGAWQATVHVVTKSWMTKLSD